MHPSGAGNWVLLSRAILIFITSFEGHTKRLHKHCARLNCSVWAWVMMMLFTAAFPMLGQTWAEWSLGTLCFERKPSRCSTQRTNTTKVPFIDGISDLKGPGLPVPCYLLLIYYLTLLFMFQYRLNIFYFDISHDIARWTKHIWQCCSSLRITQAFSHALFHCIAASVCTFWLRESPHSCFAKHFQIP